MVWFQSKHRVWGDWRSATFFLGMVSATVSTAVNVYLYVHALYTGGYPFYHPTELLCLRWGSLTALIGIVAAMTGFGKARILLAIISLLNLLGWFGDALAQ